MNCIKCGKDHNDYHFRVLQVQTLHVRDLTGEKRVQALGDFEEYDVCASCARAKYDAYMDNRAAVKKAVLTWGLLALAGLVVTVLFWNGDSVYRLFGLGMLACGAMCLYGGVKSTGTKKREMTALGEEKALYRCAWECLMDGAPRKHDINDITYIPVDRETLARKNGDLMILYDLLPEIAIEAHKRIHADEIHE